VFDQTDFLIDNNNLTGYSQTLLEIAHDSGMIQTRYEFGDDLYSQVRWGDATLPPPGEGACPPLEEGGGEGEVSFFLYDGLGSTRSLTDTDGTIIQSYDYRPFGEGIDHPGELSTNHLFTGEYFDKDLDYYYLRARYYSPGLGRFTGYDPVEDANNKLHKYAYCGNEPIDCIDPLGKDICMAAKVGLLIVAAIIVYLAAALISGVLSAKKNFWRKYQEYMGDPRYHEGNKQAGISEVNSKIKEYCERGVPSPPLATPVPYLGDIVRAVDYKKFRERMYYDNETGRGAKKRNYLLSDGKTLVSFDKFYHFASGGQLEKYIRMGEEGNLIYELYATRSGSAPFTGVLNDFGPPVGDHDKPFNPEDIRAGEAGARFQHDIEQGNVRYSDLDISKYFDPNYGWLGH